MCAWDITGIDCGRSANTPTSTVAESICGTKHVKKIKGICFRGIDTLALDAVESVVVLDQRTIPHDENIACEYAGLCIVDATTGCEVTRTDVLLAPLPAMEELVQLEEVTNDDFLHNLKFDDIDEVVLLYSKVDSTELRLSLVMDDSVLMVLQQRVESLRRSAVLKYPTDSYYSVVMEHKDVGFSANLPSGLPPERGIRHQIDREPGSKHAVLREWLLSRDQSEFIDKLFAQSKLLIW
ncbi:uncharacterized protein PHALS_10710 [Plasmopara halstedii]|uniref:Uncharacterized protein n=1 Tax=Plasmopara halstedii TaxID=4781 RepID=A0A0P1AH48_PLAHL|nr:uncharacterized protein PHALS_10710 [Plasmopara halstedii]CEG40516.1 hypothetical protein PHALS_10710 [Plasmopara halstedii]|eukprot:XP_024576885.1 hypothetical protein PHALS_10710 [Plasmopara halstedii]